MATLNALMATGRIVAVANTLLAMAPDEANRDAVHQQARVIVHANETSGSIGNFAEFLVNGGASVDGGVDILSLPLGSIVELHQRARSKSALSHPVEALAPSNLSVVSFDALRRAQTTLEDFTNFYFSIHGLSHADFFRWLPLLVFTEACIYQLDEDNEHACLAQVPSAHAAPTLAEVAMRGVLSSKGLLSPHVVQELSAGKEYWALERSLCGSMASCKPLDLEEVYRCSSLKSFVRPRHSHLQPHATLTHPMCCDGTHGATGR